MLLIAPHVDGNLPVVAVILPLSYDAASGGDLARRIAEQGLIVGAIQARSATTGSRKAMSALRRACRDTQADSSKIGCIFIGWPSDQTESLARGAWAEGFCPVALCFNDETTLTAASEPACDTLIMSYASEPTNGGAVELALRESTRYPNATMTRVVIRDASAKTSLCSRELMARLLAEWCERKLGGPHRGLESLRVPSKSWSAPAAILAIGLAPFVITYWRRRLSGLLGRAIVAVVAMSAVWLFVHALFSSLPVSPGLESVAARFGDLNGTASEIRFLASVPVPHRPKNLLDLLSYANVAHYASFKVGGPVDPGIQYYPWVISPVVSPCYNIDAACRRAFWLYFYPRMRQCASPEDSAVEIAKALRARMTLVSSEPGAPSLGQIWESQVSGAGGMNLLYVAALRSVGVPARLDDHGRAVLFFSQNKWLVAPPIPAFAL